MKRDTLHKKIYSKQEQIEKLKSEIVELNKQNFLLSDKQQQFVEENEEVLICGRPKKYETKLIGRVNWKQKFEDGDGGFVMIDRSLVVRVNGEWV